MKFTKMHGCGNDFVMMNGFVNQMPADMGAVAEKLCDRNFGIGADGVIVLYPAEGYDFEMRLFQPDGSEAEMCGNGIRCAAVFANMEGISDKKDLRVITKAGLILPTVSDDMAEVRVDMGAPRLKGSEVPCMIAAERVLEQPLEICGKEFLFSGVSMGNPHAVIFIDVPVADYPVGKYGSNIEVCGMFPAKTNVEFVEVVDEHTVNMRVWERGSGETLACGTGACATSVAAILTGRCKDFVTVKLLGGDLKIEYVEGENVYMTGAAEVSFTGDVEI